jgi:hypothetical protein
MRRAHARAWVMRNNTTSDMRYWSFVFFLKQRLKTARSALDADHFEGVCRIHRNHGVAV